MYVHIHNAHRITAGTSTCTGNSLSIACYDVTRTVSVACHDVTRTVSVACYDVTRTVSVAYYDVTGSCRSHDVDDAATSAVACACSAWRRVTSLAAVAMVMMMMQQRLL